MIDSEHYVRKLSETIGKLDKLQLQDTNNNMVIDITGLKTDRY